MGLPFRMTFELNSMPKREKMISNPKCQQDPYLHSKVTIPRLGQTETRAQRRALQRND